MESPDSFSPGQEVLSQNEVERLLAQVAEQETSAIVHQSDGEKKNQPKDSIQPYDFRNPIFLSANELRKLRVKHEEYIHGLAARLSIYLRLEFSLQMSKLQTLTYAKFTESLNNPSHLVLFRAEPLRGICVLDISPRLGLTIVDRLMGGPGHSVNSNRDLSEIEVALLDQAVQIVIGEWCSHWLELQELRPSILGHENNSRFLQTSQPDAVMLALSMEATIGDCVEQVQMGFPYSMLEPMIQRLCVKLTPSVEDAAAVAPDSRLKWRRDYEAVPIPVTAEWPSLQLTARDLTRLKVGDVLEVAPEFANQVQLRLARIPKFTGRLGVRGNKWAVEVSRVHKT
jgi:flagellar motor switch protein FliM